MKLGCSESQARGPKVLGFSACAVPFLLDSLGQIIASLWASVRSQLRVRAWHITGL